MTGSLAGIPLFHDIPRDALAAAAPGCEWRHFQKGQALFEEGRPADSVWVVRRGWVYLIKRTPQGRSVTIFVMTSDEALCGISAFDRGTYAASAIAATQTQAVNIPVAVCIGLMERYPEFAHRVLLACCERIRHMADVISLAQAPAEQRVAHTLLRLHASFGKHIPVTHQELARMAAIRWETSIRIVGVLKRRGWLASSRGQMAILQPKALQELLVTSTDGHHAPTRP